MSSTPETGHNREEPEYVLELGGLSVRQILRLHHAIEQEREEVERAFPNRNSTPSVGNSDQLPPLRQYPHCADYPDSLAEAWWEGMNRLVKTDVDRAKEVATAFVNSDDVEARKSAAFVASRIAPHDYEFTRDTLLLINADPDDDVRFMIHDVRCSVIDAITPEQAADLEQRLPRAT